MPTPHKMKTPTPTVQINIPPSLPSLGLAVLVCYVPATNSRPSGWRAVIRDLTDKVSTFVPYDHSESSQEGELRACSKALQKWITGGARFAPECMPSSATFTGKGHINGDSIYFFRYNRGEAGN